MVADSDSGIAWHRVQLRKHRQALKALEAAGFTMGAIARARTVASAPKAMAELKRKIARSERCIAEYERRTRRPLATDLNSLASVSWSNWNGCGPQPRKNGTR